VEADVRTVRTALIVIATGDLYRKHAHKLIASAHQFFVPHDVVLFTDKPEEFEGFKPITIPDLGFPRATLLRYHMIHAASARLQSFDYIFYSDADMLFVAPISGEELFSDGITATEHPGYTGLRGTPELNPLSKAYCPYIRTYFCGGFNGGTSAAFLAMAGTLRTAIDIDTKNNIMAIWHDESHLNRYLYDHPPARILNPSFCYPQSEYGHRGYYTGIWHRAGRQVTPKLIALDKETR
jgi:histo-blood group ABO system transferase